MALSVELGLNPPSRTLSGTLLCGVRTFLSLRPKAQRATVRSGCLRTHYISAFRLPAFASGARPRFWGVSRLMLVNLF